MADSDAAALARRLATAQLIQPPMTANTALQLKGGSVQSASGTSLADGTGIVSGALIPLVINQGAINSSVNTSGTSLVTVNTVTFTLARAANIWSFVTGSISRNDANAGVFTCNYGMQLDGLYPSSFGPTPNLWGDFVPVTMAAALNNGTLTVPATFLTVWLSVPSGSHSLAVVCQSSGANGVFNVSGNPAVLSFGS